MFVANKTTQEGEYSGNMNSPMKMENETVETISGTGGGVL
jgi:hypothetical protein